MQIPVSVRQRPTQFFASARPFFCLLSCLSLSLHIVMQMKPYTKANWRLAQQRERERERGRQAAAGWQKVAKMTSSLITFQHHCSRYVNFMASRNHGLSSGAGLYLSCSHFGWYLWADKNKKKWLNKSRLVERCFYLNTLSSLIHYNPLWKSQKCLLVPDKMTI